jgi:hypothetical protein
MPTVQPEPVGHTAGHDPITEELRVQDWLGLADYLTGSDVTAEVAQQRLGDAADDTAEFRALNRAALRAESEESSNPRSSVLRAIMERARRERDR